MIQCEEQKTDIYQILTFCLGHLKRKILTLFKILVNNRNCPSKPQLILQLAQQQLKSQEYVQILKNNSTHFLQKEEKILFERFVCRIKQLVRNYLPYASVSKELFIYLKKVETHSFKQSFKLEDYLITILQQNPSQLQEEILIAFKELKELNQLQRQKTKFCQIRNESIFDQNCLYLDLGQSNKLTRIQNENSNLPKEWINQFQNQKEYRLKYFASATPYDIFNKSLKSTTDCLDCDTSIIRAIYFKIQKQKEGRRNPQELTFDNQPIKQFSVYNQSLSEIEEVMLNHNRYIRESINIFDKEYCRFQSRLQRNRNYAQKIHNRSQTADISRRAQSLSLEIKQSNEYKKMQNRKSPTKNKFETINHFTSEQEKKQLYKQIQNKRNNVLKMKSISLSDNKGHLQLCSENNEQKKRMSFTFANFKQTIVNSNRKNPSNNLRRKYQIYLNNQTQNHSKELLNFTLKSQNLINFHDFAFQNNEKMGSTKIKIFNQNRTKLSLSENTITENTKESNIIQSNRKIYMQKKRDASILNDDEEGLKNENQYDLGRSNESCLRYHNQNRNKESSNLQNKFHVSIKSMMRGTNVNHRNFTNIQIKSKKLFETINPDLNIKVIKKT